MEKRKRTRDQLRAFFAKLGNRVRKLFPKKTQKKYKAPPKGKTEQELMEHFRSLPPVGRTPEQQAFDPYKERLLKRNAGLVHSIAQRYNRKGHSLSYDDLFQEGQMGMLKALDTFEPNKGTKFSTFAVPHIRGAITRAIEESGANIRIASNVQWNRNNIAKAERAFEAKFGRSPSDDELVKVTKLTKRQIKAARDSEMLRTTSLNRPIGRGSGEEGNEEGEFGGRRMDFIESPYDSPEELQIQRQDYNTQTKFLVGAMNNTKLTQMERKVIFHKYGPLAEDETDSATVARKLGLSRARVTQLEQSAINKMRGDKEGKLRKFLDRSTKSKGKKKNA